MTSTTGGASLGGSIGTAGGGAAGEAGVGGVGGAGEGGAAGFAGFGGEAGAGGAPGGVCAGKSLGVTGGPSSCADSTVWTYSVRTPALYIMMDRSSSMLYAVPNSQQTRWEAATEGIATFAEDSSARSTFVALNFFGASEFGGDDVVDCNVQNYVTPEVDFKLLSSDNGALATAMSSNQPAGLTPTLPALEGALQGAAAWSGPGLRSVVFITDGYPTQCQDPVSVAEIAAAAGGGFDSAGVRTFVVGLAAGFSLDSIAKSGRTIQATLLDEGDPATSLADTLEDIVTRRAPCEIGLPATPESLDAVWLRFSPLGAAEEEIPHLSGAAACARSSMGGWYVDDLTAPTVIQTCPCTCERLKGIGTLQLLIGSGC